jgi:isoleucyl-tRNA synthetase
MDFPETPASWLDQDLAATWEALRDARRVVTGALEVQRTAKVIGSSLEAAPQVFVSPGLAALLGQVDFADLCITSGISVSSEAAPEGAFALADVPGVAVVFQPAVGQKCERCWQILPDVGTHKHPATCQRCNDALG